jgi:hypothetical protein
MRSAIPLSCAALALALAAGPAGAKGGSMQPKINKDFRELIVKGERPEIAPCLAAAIDYARHSKDFTAVRWDDDQSDRAILWESADGGRFERHVRVTVQMRSAGSAIFAEVWRPVAVSCEQGEDGAVRLVATPLEAASR